MRSLFSTVLALSTSALLGLACGGSQPPASPPVTDVDASAPKEAPAADDAGAASAPAPTTTDSTAAATPTPAPAGEGGSFDALPKDKKVEIMATKVVPNVGKLFKEHDGAKFGKFGCATCHGPSKKADPRDVLPKLSFKNGGYEKLAKSKPEMMKLMNEKVLPEMVKALGEAPFDPKTNKGFGCAGCHKID